MNIPEEYVSQKEIKASLIPTHKKELS